MPSVVFDTSAILALLRNDRGADTIAENLGDGIISAVTFLEVMVTLMQEGIPAARVSQMIRALHLDVRPHDSDCAFVALDTYSAGCSVSDLACIALAWDNQLPVLTANSLLVNLESPPVEIKLAE